MRRPASAVIAAALVAAILVVGFLVDPTWPSVCNGWSVVKYVGRE